MATSILRFYKFVMTQFVGAFHPVGFECHFLEVIVQDCFLLLLLLPFLCRHFIIGAAKAPPSLRHTHADWNFPSNCVSTATVKRYFKGLGWG